MWKSSHIWERVIYQDCIHEEIMIKLILWKASTIQFRIFCLTFPLKKLKY
jgi:hypothetical protein